MVTSKEYTRNLKNGIITKEMLCDCLYSVNKRAKNARDNEQKYAKIRRSNRYYYDKYGYEDQYEEQKRTYYSMKERLLSIVEPTCIHIEQQEQRKRVYDYEEAFQTYGDADIIYSNSYFDNDRNRRVKFIDVMVTVDKFYLFYDFGAHSFHTPIKDVTGYPDLAQHRIGTLTTYGHAVEELISVPFVKKVIALLDSGQYAYLCDNNMAE